MMNFFREKTNRFMVLKLLFFICFSGTSFAQQLTVSGIVTEENGGIPIPGVNIIVKNTNKGAVTDFDGNYQIQADTDDVLVFSFLGYEPIEVIVTTSVINVSLKEDTEKLNEVVIIGYGTTTVKDATGSITSVTSKDFNKGNIVTPGAGYLLQPQVTIPEDAISIVVSQDGEVSVTVQGQAEPAVIGQINTVNFVNPTGLEPIGQNLFTETGVSGAPQEGVPGLEGYGMIVQGALETSNVNTTEELVNLIESQRVYEMNSKVISAVDEMLSYINQQL